MSNRGTPDAATWWAAGVEASAARVATWRLPAASSAGWRVSERLPSEIATIGLEPSSSASARPTNGPSPSTDRPGRPTQSAARPPAIAPSYSAGSPCCSVRRRAYALQGVVQSPRAIDPDRPIAWRCYCGRARSWAPIERREPWRRRPHRAVVASHGTSPSCCTPTLPADVPWPRACKGRWPRSAFRRSPSIGHNPAAPASRWASHSRPTDTVFPLRPFCPAAGTAARWPRRVRPPASRCSPTRRRHPRPQALRQPPTSWT